MRVIRTGHRILLLTAVFLMAFIFNIYLSQRQTTASEDADYEALPVSALPVISTDINGITGGRLNIMHGYKGDISSDVTADTLTILPADRRLPLHISSNGSYISGITYEIRMQDTSELVERTTLSDYTRSADGIDAVLSVPNLIIRDREYTLDVILSVEGSGDVYYHSRLIMPEEQQTVQEMLTLALDFSARNYDYETARANTTYVETDGSADDTTLAYTTLKSTFKNLAYADLDLAPAGDKDVRLLHYDGNSGEILIRTMASGGGGAQADIYEIEESFSMRVGIERIYMMNYSRRIREVFTVAESNLVGRRLTLGINEESELSYMTGGEGRYVYFVATRDLWAYDTREGEMRRVWSLRGDDLLDIDSAYQKNAVDMLRTDASGGLTFLAYGYMSRGEHEGQTGISVMYYDTAECALTERFFIPVAQTYEKLDQDMKKLAHLGSNSVLYIKVGDTVYGIDMMSEGVIEIVSGVREGMYHVSDDMSKLAWQEKADAAGSEIIHILDMDTGVKREIKAGEGKLLRSYGFIGRDLAVAICLEGKEWRLNGLVRAVPASAIEMYDDELAVVKHYEKEGQYIFDVGISDGRINMTLAREQTGGTFVISGEDTIVSSVLPPTRSEGIGSYISEDRGRIFYVQMNENMGRSGSRVQNVTAVRSSRIVLSRLGGVLAHRYDAYAEGRMTGSYETLTDAISAVYARMGSVRCDGMLIYNRAGTVTSRIIADVQYQAQDILKARENGTMQSLFGLGLRPLLYFVGIRCPVLAYDADGRPLLIYAYDKTDISIYDIEEDKKYRKPIDEAAAEFETAHNDFGYVPAISSSF